ncbi:MAG: type II toxin-antitoxin system VapC family toxin [Microbacteriaceae bacterium]
MTLYLLDTDMSSYLLKGQRKVAPPIFHRGDSIGISSITVMELQYGVALAGVATDLLSRVTLFLDQIESFSFDDNAAGSAARVRGHLRSIGKPSGTYDILIAGHALALGATLVTNNTKHFENIPGLTLQNWAN